MHWRITSPHPDDPRVELAVAMAQVMAPRGLVVTGGRPGAPPREVIACLQEVGLGAPTASVVNDPPHTLLFLAEAADAQPPSSDAHRVVVLEVPAAPLDDPQALRAVRERLREHLRRLMARREDRPADPEASPGWIRDVDRQRD